MRSVTARRSLTAILFTPALIVALARCSGGPTEPRVPPEPAPDAVSIGQETTGTLAAGAAREYSLLAPANATLLLSLQAQTGASNDTLVLRVYPPGGGAPLAESRSAGSQSGLHDALVVIPAVSTARTLRLTVTGAAPSHGGPFRFLVRELGEDPERRARAIAHGEVVNEAIDAPGDVDVFTFPASHVTYFTVDLAATTPFPAGLQLEVLDGARILTTVRTADAQPDLGVLSTPAVVPPRSGEFALRVRGLSVDAANTGAYRLRINVAPLAPPPEPRLLARTYAIIDTLGGSDSLTVFDVPLSFDEARGIGIEMLSAAPDDSLVVSLRDRASNDSVLTFAVSARGGPATVALPSATSSVQWLRATVRGRMQSVAATYRIRHGSSLPDAPETVPSVLVPEDTLDGETIADELEFDTYLLDAPSGSEWAVMVAPGAPSSQPIGVRVYDRDWQHHDSWDVMTTSLDLERSTFHLRLGDRGPYRLVIGRAVSSGTGAFVGRYRVHLLPIDRSPEDAPASLVPDAPLRSVIGRPGDIDEFRFEVRQGQEYYFHHRYPAGADQDFWIVDGPSEAAVPLLPPNTPLPLDQVNATRWIAPRTGTFTVRVHSGLIAESPAYWPTPYEIEAQLVRRTPESVPSGGWAFGDTIAGESIERRGDVDEFELTVDSAMMTRLTFAVDRADTATFAALTVLDASGTEFGWATIGGAAPPAGPASTTIAHLEFPEAGTYLLRVEGTGLSAMPFRIHLAPSYLGPESIGDTIAVGSWIEGEAIDSIGDADRFVYHADSGVQYVAEIEGVPASGGQYGMFSNVVSARSDEPGFGAAPRSGWIRLQVQSVALGTPSQGPYRFRIRAVNPGPESSPTAIAIGDTVRTESVDHIGDIDHFSFDAVEGTALRLHVRSSNADQGAQLLAYVLEENGWILASMPVGAQHVDFVMPRNARFRIRVQPTPWTASVNLAPYEIALVRR